MKTLVSATIAAALSFGGTALAASEATAEPLMLTETEMDSVIAGRAGEGTLTITAADAALAGGGSPANGLVQLVGRVGNEWDESPPLHCAACPVGAAHISFTDTP